MSPAELDKILHKLDPKTLTTETGSQSAVTGDRNEKTKVDSGEESGPVGTPSGGGSKTDSEAKKTKSPVRIVDSSDESVGQPELVSDSDSAVDAKESEEGESSTDDEANQSKQASKPDAVSGDPVSRSNGGAGSGSSGQQVGPSPKAPR